MQPEAPGPDAQSGSRRHLGLFLRGLCMGSADVVPGVSGGTMAFILGIYEELVESIRAVARPPFLRALLGRRWGEALAILNWRFLLAVGAGIVVAILSLAKALSWLLAHTPVLLWSFFFGLVLASVVVVSTRVQRWTWPLGISLAVGTVGAYVLVGLVPVQTPNAPWFLFLSGALAICAMILPGISGAFILVLLGKYQYVLQAVNERDVATLAYVLAGIAVGIVSFAQVLGWLFRRYHDLTVALLTGLMLGSLRKVWPWKLSLEFVEGRHGELVPSVQENVLPALTAGEGLNGELAVALGLALVGFAFVVVLERWARQQPSEHGSSADTAPAP
jgi:putative membrane protein